MRNESFFSAPQLKRDSLGSVLRPILVLLSVASILPCSRGQSASSVGQLPKSAPRFEDYPGEPLYRGPTVSPRLDTPDARNYRTAIRHAAARGPQFDGHYAVASWGCGTSCQFHAIIDVKSGAVYMTNLQTALDVEYHLDSRLFIKNRPEVARHWCMPGSAIEPTSWYYEWTGSQLRLIDSVYQCPS